MSLWLPPLVYMAAIFYFSSESQPLPMLTEHVWDKILHSIEYAGLAILLFRALDGEELGWRRSAVLAVIIVSAYGASDEWHQLFVAMRSSDVEDWLTDTGAGAIGAAACVVFQRAHKRSTHVSTPSRPPRRLRRSRPGR